MSLPTVLTIALLALLPRTQQAAPAGNHLPETDLVPGGPSQVDVLTFEALPAGAIAAEVYGRFGSGPVLVYGTNPQLPGVNAAVIFDSAMPTGGDTDLGTPNQDFGGPGVGASGEADGAYPNRRPLGHLVIVGDDLTDSNGDGLVDDPGDASGQGTVLTFDFSPVGGARLEALTIIDVESLGLPAVVEMIGSAGELLDARLLPVVGNNGVARIPLGGVPGVMILRVALNGSAALDNIVFRPFEGSHLRGRVWNDDDEDGLQGAQEPGLAGAALELSTGALGPVATLVTDAQGRYSLDGLAPGSYTLTVVENSLPRGAFPTPCNVGEDDSIDSDCSPATIQVGFVSRTITNDFGYAAPPQCEGAIGDLVFEDVNGNNVQDLGDVGIPGVTVNLLDAVTGQILDTQVTDLGGGYLFGGLCEGEYAVGVDFSTIDIDLGPAICDVGDDGSVDSECGPECVIIFEQDALTGLLENRTIDWGFRQCGSCDGKATALSLRFNGVGPVFVEIVPHNNPTVFAEVVENGDILSFFGNDNHDTLGRRVNIFVDGVFKGEIHTSCSQPLFIGLTEGDFEVLAGTSRHGGALCASGAGG